MEDTKRWWWLKQKAVRCGGSSYSAVACAWLPRTAWSGTHEPAVELLLHTSQQTSWTLCHQQKPSLHNLTRTVLYYVLSPNIQGQLLLKLVERPDNYCRCFVAALKTSYQSKYWGKSRCVSLETVLNFSFGFKQVYNFDVKRLTVYNSM